MNRRSERPAQRATAGSSCRNVAQNGTAESSETQQLQKPRELKDILLDARRTTGRTLEVGEDTQKELRMQNETMDRTDESLDRIEHKLRISDRTVKSMDGFSGMVSAFFSRKPKPPPPRKPAVVPSIEPAYTEKKSGGFLSFFGFKGSSKPAPEPPAKKVTMSGLSDEEEAVLDCLQRDVDEIKNQATLTGAMLDQQNKQLDEMNEKSGKVMGHMQRTTKNIRKIT